MNIIPVTMASWRELFNFLQKEYRRQTIAGVLCLLGNVYESVKFVSCQHFLDTVLYGIKRPVRLVYR
jgi:hypothetical protein